jgi:PP-loop superfamily ATP-utilizing enzyme
MTHGANADGTPDARPLIRAVRSSGTDARIISLLIAEGARPELLDARGLSAGDHARDMISRLPPSHQAEYRVKVQPLLQ